MLAESGLSWSDQWEQEGMEKGLQQALEKVRTTLLRELERRFGPLSERVRRRVDAIDSLEGLTELSVRAGSASSLDELAS